MSKIGFYSEKLVSFIFIIYSKIDEYGFKIFQLKNIVIVYDFKKNLN